jgi:hypothetical protein
MGSTAITSRIIGINQNTGGAAALNSLDASGQGFLTGGPVGAVVAGVSSLIGSLAQHSARLAGAKSENQALVQVIPAFDADLTQIIQAYNSGQISASQAVAALGVVDAAIKKYLMSQVGKPGTAWNETVGISGKCNSSCTAGCCIYYGDLGPPLSLAMLALGGSGTHWGANDPRISQGASGVTIQVPQVYASKFGGTNRAGYSITILNRPGSASNPSQFGQGDLPIPPPRLGLVSEGTVVGQTTPFSYSSQGLLDNASAVSSPLSVGVANNTGLFLVGLGAVAVILVAMLASE